MKTKRQRMIELFARLSALGFTYEESAALRRIEMTLQRWGELECGNDRGCIERDEVTGKPFFTYETARGPRGRYAVADREKGALKRLGRIIADRNTRNWINSGVAIKDSPGFIYAFHQGDCRGRNLYLLTREQLTGKDGTLLPLDRYYTRGLAVCE